MEMVHQPFSNNFNNNYNGYGNFNHQNDKPFQFNNYDNRPFSKPKTNLESRFPFSNLNLIRNGNFNKHDSSSQDLDKSDYIEFKPGMQDVPGWLKSLRLHKYKLIFSELTYEEMLGLTEQQLEEKNVTKGARHKIIVNIDKLRARQANVVNMEKSIEQEGVSGIKQSLNELKAMLSTPIKAFEHDKVSKEKSKDEVVDGDLPGQIMKLIEKIFPYFQNDMITDDEIVSLFLSTVARCLSHDAFEAGQKQRLIQIETRVENKFNEPVLKYATGHKSAKEKQWNANKKMMLFKTNNQNYLNPYKTISNNSLNSNHSSNGFETNGFNDQYTNSSLNNPHFHHPYQQNGNPIKFNGNSNYSSLNSSTQSFYSKSSQMKQNSLNLVSSGHLSSSTNIFTNNKMQKLNSFNQLNKSNENHYGKHTFNVNAECFTSTKSAETLNNGKNGALSNGRKLSENRFPFGDHQLNKFSDAFGEFDDKQIISNQNNQNDSNKILSPLSSCSLFNACSQIGKFNKLNNHLNSFDKLNGLESSLKQSNQLIFGNLLSDANLMMKCLEENNSTLANSNAFSHPKSESNFDFGEKYDDKLDENHQIYSHIELLSLRMTEQALGSSEFS